MCIPGSLDNHLPSISPGVLLAAPFVTAGLVAAAGHEWSLHTPAAALPGVVSGCVWNAGNALSIVATRDPDVGLAVAYPRKQSLTISTMVCNISSPH